MNPFFIGFITGGAAVGLALLTVIFRQADGWKRTARADEDCIGR
ncbi:hypothetical protein [Azospirillum sp. sgz302134]